MEFEYNEEYLIYRKNDKYNSKFIINYHEVFANEFLKKLGKLIDKKRIIYCGRDDDSYYYGVLNEDSTITKYTIYDSNYLYYQEKNKQIDLELDNLFNIAKKYIKEVEEKRDNMNKGFKNIFKKNLASLGNEHVLMFLVSLHCGIISILLTCIFDINFNISPIFKLFMVLANTGIISTLFFNICTLIKTCKEIKSNRYLKEIDEKFLQEENYNKLISESKEKTNENNKNKYHEEIITKARELDELINKLSTENKKKYKSLIIEELNKYMESLNNSNKNEINLTLNTPDYTRIHCTIFLEGMKTEVLKLLEEEQHKNEINSLIEDINAPVILNIPSNKEKVKVKTNKNK